jgi:hypothetical protein
MHHLIQDVNSDHESPYQLSLYRCSLGHTRLVSTKFAVGFEILSAVNVRYFYVRFEVITAVAMKNVVFWDIGTQFVLHRRHITSLLLSPAG